MKRLFIAATIALFASTTVAHAQFGSGIVFDPMQSAHAVQQILQGSQLYTTTVQTAENVIGTYNLAQQMAIAPQSLYQPYLSPSTYWAAVNQAANTYGNSQPWTNAANTGTGAQYAYQEATIPRASIIPQYSSLSTNAQRNGACQRL